MHAFSIMGSALMHSSIKNFCFFKLRTNIELTPVTNPRHLFKHKYLHLLAGLRQKRESNSEAYASKFDAIELNSNRNIIVLV